MERTQLTRSPTLKRYSISLFCSALLLSGCTNDRQQFEELVPNPITTSAPASELTTSPVSPTPSTTTSESQNEPTTVGGDPKTGILYSFIGKTVSEGIFRQELLSADGGIDRRYDVLLKCSGDVPYASSETYSRGTLVKTTKTYGFPEALPNPCSKNAITAEAKDSPAGYFSELFLAVQANSLIDAVNEKLHR